MKTFSNFISEVFDKPYSLVSISEEQNSQLSKDEEDVLKMFTKKGDKRHISITKSTGRIRGGAKTDKGKRAYKAALSLIDKGYLKLLKRTKDSFVDSLHVELIAEPNLELSSYEKRLLDGWLKWSDEGGFSSKGYQYGPARGRKSPPKKERDAFDRLKSLGMIDGSLFDPERP